MKLARWIEDRLLKWVADQAVATAVHLGHNRLPLGETDLSDHPDEDVVVIDPGSPEAQPPS